MSIASLLLARLPALILLEALDANPYESSAAWWPVIGKFVTSKGRKTVMKAVKSVKPSRTFG